MLDFFQKVKNEKYDAIFFLPGREDDEMRIELNVYKNPGEKVGGAEHGDGYHIVTFKIDDDYNVVDVDRFEGILTSPFDYVSHLIKHDIYGIVAKSTTTSNNFIESTIAKLKAV